METLHKIKGFFRESASREKVLTVAIIFLVGSASFGLGRLSLLDERKEPVRIENIPMEAQVPGVIELSEQKSSQKAQVAEDESLENNPSLQAGGFLVGSKNGSKYHFPWCSGAQRILDKNKIYFSSAKEARASGYTPAANCKGLE